MANSEWRMANRGTRNGCSCGRAFRRPAFTFVELMLASMITAMTAVAAVTLVGAISNASVHMRDQRKMNTTGHYALSRVATAIRSARAVGEVTPTTITLWVKDTNGDDAVSVNELASIQYDAGAKQIKFRTTESVGLMTEAPEGMINDFDLVEPKMDMLGVETMVWAADIEAFAFQGFPDYTDTRIVEARFTVGTGGEEVAFQTTASPKGSADYLFVNEAQAAPLPESTRIRRAHFSRWEGFGDLNGG